MMQKGRMTCAAHVRSLIIGHELTLPIRERALGLGTWQGIYLWEHRNGAMRRKIIVTLTGEALERRNVPPALQPSIDCSRRARHAWRTAPEANYGDLQRQGDDRI